MTAPTPDPQPVQDPEVQPPPDTGVDASTVVTIAGLLAAASAVGATYEGAKVARTMAAQTLQRDLGVSWSIAFQLVTEDANRPVSPTIPLSESVANATEDGPGFRARYLVNAAKRVLKSLPPGGQTPSEAITTEKRYFRQHQNAQTGRQQAAQRLDGAINSYGELLGWYAVDDNRTTVECHHADGKNFYPAKPPKIGLPGVTHVNCRCWAGPPHVDAELVDPTTGPGTVAAAREGAPMALELAQAKTTASGDTITKSGLVYNAQTNSFRVATDAEKKGGSFNSKHPRAAAGSPAGGQFVPLGSSSSSQGAAAQKNAGAVANYKKIGALPPGQQTAAMKALSPADLAALAAVANSFKAPKDPKLAAKLAAFQKKITAVQTAQGKHSAAVQKHNAAVATSAQKKSAAAATSAQKKTAAAQKHTAAVAASTQKKAAAASAKTAKTAASAKTKADKAAASQAKHDAAVKAAAAKASASASAKSAKATSSAAAKSASAKASATKAAATAQAALDKALAAEKAAKPSAKAAAKTRALIAYAKAKSAAQAAGLKPLPALQLAVQDGSVPVRSAGDGPRMTSDMSLKSPSKVCALCGKSAKAALPVGVKRLPLCPTHAKGRPTVELSAKTAGYSGTHSPLGTGGLWKHKGWQLPAYIQNVAKGIMESGADRSKAIQIAVGKVRDWAEGKGNVSPEVRAASVKAIAEWEALKGRAHAVKLARLASGAIELAAINKHHVPGTAYHWWHNYRPRDVATALQWKKTAAAAKLHKSGAGHFNTEPGSWWKSHPTLPKTLPANRKLGGLTPVSKAPKVPPATRGDFLGKHPLTPAEKAAIQDYGSPSGYKTVNPYLNNNGQVYDSSIGALRPAKPNEKAFAEKTIRNLDSAFGKATPLNHEVTVLRRSGAEQFGPNAMAPGHVFENPAYVSTALPGGQKNGYGYESKKVAWEITLPKGTMALQGNAHENEILLPRGTKFEVTSDSIAADGTRNLKVRAVPATKAVAPDKAPNPMAASPAGPVKQTKGGKHVIQGPVGAHPVGSTVHLPLTDGRTLPVKVTSVGKEFNVKGVPSQYHYTEKLSPAPSKAPTPTPGIGKASPAKVQTSEAFSSTGLAVSGAKLKAGNTGATHYVSMVDGKPTVTSTKPSGKHIEVLATGSIKPHAGDTATKLKVQGPASSMPEGMSPAQATKAEKLKQGVHNSGMPAYVYADGTHSSEPLLYSKGGETPYVVNPDGSVTKGKPAAQTPAAPKELVNTKGEAPPQDVVDTISSIAATSNKPVYLVPGDSTPSGFKIQYTAPADGTAHLAASPKGHVMSTSSDGVSTVVKAPSVNYAAPKAMAAPIHPDNVVGVDELKAMPDITVDPKDSLSVNIAAMQKAIKTGKPVWVVGDSPNKTMSDTAPTSGLWRQYAPNGDIYKGNASLGTSGQKLGPMATDYANTAKNEGMHLGPKVQPLSATPFNTADEAGNSAKWLAKNSGTGSTTFYTAPAPNGGWYVYKEDPKLPGTAAYNTPPVIPSNLTNEEASMISSAQAAAQHFKVPAYISPNGQLLTKPDGPVPATVKVMPDGTVTKLNAYPAGPADSVATLIQQAKYGKTFPSKTNAEKQATAFQKAVKTGQTHYYPGTDGGISTDKPVYPSGNYGEFKPDGSVVVHTPDGGLAPNQVAPDKLLGVVGQFVGPKPASKPKAPGVKGKMPPTKAVTGMGPTTKALYNAPTIQNNGNLSVAHAAALQAAVKTGKTTYLDTSGGENVIVPNKPLASPHLAFSPDGSVMSYSAYGTSSPIKNSVMKKHVVNAIGDSTPGLGGAANSPTTPNVGNMTPGPVATYKGIPKGLETNFEGTVAGQFLSANGGAPVLSESLAGKHYAANVSLSSTERGAIGSYTGAYAYDVNTKLRKSHSLSSYDVGKVKALDTAMAKYATTDTIVVRRGMSNSDLPQENLAGKPYQDAGYGSTSFGQGFEGTAKWTILVPAGTHAVVLAGAGSANTHGHEKELLLARGTQYLIEKDVTIGGTRYLTATVIASASVHAPVSATAKVTHHGVVPDAATRMQPGAYKAEGLLYLQQNGRAAWLAKYGKGGSGTVGQVAQPVGVGAG